MPQHTPVTFDTLAVHGARGDLVGLGAHVPPIDLSTTAPLTGVESGGDSYENLAGGGALAEEHSTVYQRLWNPTVARFEEALAGLEGAQESVAYASGMAALTAALLAMVQSGKRHVVGVRPLYGGTDHILATNLLGTHVSWAEADGVKAAITRDTGLVVIESPGNPTLELVDIADVVRQAGDVPVLVDNTFATPVLQRPLELGATLVMHSATKYLGGHGDVLAGVIATDAAWATRLRRVRALTGGILHPLSAYLAHRGLQTLPIRVRAQQENAQAVAAWLAEQPQVQRLFYPGAPGCDPTGLVGRQMSGPGSILAFDMGDYSRAAHVADHVELITHAVSLGGVDSLTQHPASLTHRPVAPEARPVPGVLRLSVGLESPADLIADLERAMRD